MESWFSYIAWAIWVCKETEQKELKSHKCYSGIFIGLQDLSWSCLLVSMGLEANMLRQILEHRYYSLKFLNLRNKQEVIEFLAQSLVFSCDFWFSLEISIIDPGYKLYGHI